MPVRAPIHRPIQFGARQHQPSREKTAARGYSGAWVRLRMMKLRADPVCQMPGCEQPATEVHHVIALADGGENTLGNLESLCKPCHSRETARRTHQGGRFG